MEAVNVLLLEGRIGLIVHFHRLPGIDGGTIYYKGDLISPNARW